MKLAIGSDHAGFAFKGALAEWLRSPEGGGYEVMDVGTDSEDSCDYPDFAKAVAQAVAKKRAAKGILLCGTGIGMAIAANKVKGVRAAVVWNPQVAALSAEHNGANVICLAARWMNSQDIQQSITAFLKTPFGGGRHLRRVRKITAMDKCE